MGETPTTDLCAVLLLTQKNKDTPKNGREFSKNVLHTFVANVSLIRINLRICKFQCLEHGPTELHICIRPFQATRSGIPFKLLGLPFHMLARQVQFKQSIQEQCACSQKG